MTLIGIVNSLGWVVLAMGVLLAVPGQPAAGEVREREGYAYSLDSGELLYRELHRTRLEGGEPATEQVTYREPGGRVMAVKTIDYGERPMAPDFRLIMEDIGYQEGMRSLDGGREVFYEPVGGEGVRRAAMDAEGLVADAGFDRLIERRLEALRSGEGLTFDFLVPSRLEAYAFQAEPAGEAEVFGQPAIRVRLEPANFFFRWLAGGMEVFYHREDGRLLRYRGLSNLRDASGNNFQVQVDFPPEGVTPLKRLEALEDEDDPQGSEGPGRVR
ncbi:hypothetical protein [Thiohalorhabdus methylotrophus]|uniref:Outer membrane lipoprotein-sorting protein n=1 Tax=Thiohalorhabdus methylotrophus TaxID=3242694 RepID=A0ABV4TUJ8_9GAMM